MSSDMTQPSDIAISIHGLGKCYQMYEKPFHRLLQGVMKTRRYAKEFWAVRNLDIQIKRGETFGIIGRNGSGKSTLLQMIAGTLNPTEGNVTVNGKVAALLELGSGFNPDFTGRENIFLNAAILGLSKNQVEERLDSILAFADIGEFIDQPVRSYSSGMAVRLAFAVVAHVNADILIVDEALSVGDAFFSQKCMRFLRDFQKTGTLLFVSHDSSAVTNLCDRAMWMENGQLRMQGDSKSLIEAYLAQQHVATRHGHKDGEFHIRENRKIKESMDDKDVRLSIMEKLDAKTKFKLFEFNPDETGMEFGAGGALIRNVEMCDSQGMPMHVMEGGEIVCLEITVELLEPLRRMIIGFYLKDRLGQRLFGDNTHLNTLDDPMDGEKGDKFIARFLFRMPTLPSGSYLFDVAVASGTQEDHIQHHWVHDALQIKTTDTTMRHGLIGIPMLDIQISKESA